MKHLARGESAPADRAPATTPVFLLAALLLAVRAHMDCAPTEARLWAADPRLPWPPDDLAWTGLARAGRVGDHLPGWVTGALPLAYFAAFLGVAERRAGRGVASPLLVLAAALLTRAPWHRGLALNGALFPLPLLFLLPRGPRAAGASALVVIAIGLLFQGTAPLAVVLLAAAVLAGGPRGRAQVPALVLAIAGYAALYGAAPPPGLTMGTAPWRSPGPSGFGPFPLHLGLVATAGWLAWRGPGPRARRMPLAAAALATLALPGARPLLVAALLPALARRVQRAWACRLGAGPRPQAALALLVVSGLAPLRHGLGPAQPLRGMRLGPRLPATLRRAVVHRRLGPRDVLACPPPHRAEVAALTAARVTPPLWGPRPAEAPSLHVLPAGLPAPPGGPFVDLVPPVGGLRLLAPRPAAPGG